MSILPPITSETQWKPAPGLERFYAVSDSGHLISLRGWYMDRPDGRTSKNLGKLLSPQTDDRGYVRYQIWDEYGERRSCAAHQLVYRAFIGEIPDGCELDHDDDSPNNNHISNLKPMTHQENTKKSYRNGRRDERVPRGEKSPAAKIKERDIETIFSLAASGMSQREIAKLYGVTHVAIGYVLRGATWKHKEREAFEYEGARARKRVILTAKDVIKIRQLAAAGVSVKMIADKFGCSENYAIGIINRRFWPKLSHQIPMFQEA